VRDESLGKGDQDILKRTWSLCSARKPNPLGVFLRVHGLWLCRESDADRGRHAEGKHTATRVLRHGNRRSLSGSSACPLGFSQISFVLSPHGQDQQSSTQRARSNRWCRQYQFRQDLKDYRDVLRRNRSWFPAFVSGGSLFPLLCSLVQRGRDSCSFKICLDSERVLVKRSR
jgi:hypothetical protein